MCTVFLLSLIALGDFPTASASMDYTEYFEEPVQSCSGRVPAAAELLLLNVLSARPHRIGRFPHRISLHVLQQVLQRSLSNCAHAAVNSCSPSHWRCRGSRQVGQCLCLDRQQLQRGCRSLAGLVCLGACRGYHQAGRLRHLNWQLLLWLELAPRSHCAWGCAGHVVRWGSGRSWTVSGCKPGQVAAAKKPATALWKPVTWACVIAAISQIGCYCAWGCVGDAVRRGNGCIGQAAVSSWLQITCRSYVAWG